jgi:hypothetical protein
MSRPCFFAPQTFDATHAFLTGTQASRRATTGACQRVRSIQSMLLVQAWYSTGGNVIPEGITATEAGYE